MFLAIVLFVNDSNSKNSENENFYQGAKMPETQYFRFYEEQQIETKKRRGFKTNSQLYKYLVV